MGLLKKVVHSVKTTVDDTIGKRNKQDSSITQGIPSYTTTAKEGDSGSSPTTKKCSKLPDENGGGWGDDTSPGADLAFGVIAAPVYIIRDAVNPPDMEKLAKQGVPKMVGNNTDSSEEHEVMHLPNYKVDK